MSTSPKIRFIWSEKNIDSIYTFYDFGTNFYNDVNVTILCAELSPPIEDVSFVHFTGFNFQFSYLNFFNPTMKTFNLKSIDLTTITVVAPRKILYNIS